MEVKKEELYSSESEKDTAEGKKEVEASEKGPASSKEGLLKPEDTSISELPGMEMLNIEHQTAAKGLNGRCTCEVLDENDHPRVLISKLCKLMHKHGWTAGTSGGVAIKQNNMVWITPSDVQKDRLQPEDIFECNEGGEVVQAPVRPLRFSSYGGVYLTMFAKRGQGAVFHSQAEESVFAAFVFLGREFRITHIEMIKGITKGTSNVPYRFDEQVVVPIVENKSNEYDTEESIRTALEKYPDANAVLVRRHGIFIWGNNWQTAKAQAECYHYLFRIAIQMKIFGIDSGVSPDKRTGRPY